MIYYAKTHTGYVRRNNEDACFVPPDGKGFFAAVADGMGGHNAGEIASRITIDTLAQTLGGMSPAAVTESVMRGAFSEANARVFAQSQSDPEQSGMGSTATAAVFNHGKAMIGHAGDSRAYHYHGGCLKQITRDHSYVQMLLDFGYITERQAEGHPQKNIITRAVGTEEELVADIYAVTLLKGDCLLLCTDGLNVMVPDSRIAKILADGFDEAAERLVTAALEAGGVDNVTVVLACMDGENA